MEPGKQQRTGLPRDKRPDGLWGSSRGRGSRGTFDKLKPDALLSNKNSMNYAKETFRGLNNGFLATPPIKHLALRLERPTDYLLKREFIEKGIHCLAPSLSHSLSHAHSLSLSLFLWARLLSTMTEMFAQRTILVIMLLTNLLWKRLSKLIEAFTGDQNRATKHFQGKTAD